METRVDSGPGFGMFAITPSDTVDLAVGARSLYITVAGDVKFNGFDGKTVTVTVPANYTLACRVTRVFATGTTATGIFGYV